MDLQLGGKRALVTGSNTGIGKGIARVLAREGATVIVHGRNEERCRTVAEELRGNGGNAVFAIGDLATDEGADSVSRSVSGQTGGVDILVNNAGGSDSDDNATWFSPSSTDWIAHYQQNTVAVARLVQRLVPGMRDQGWGRVVNVSTAGAIEPGALMPDYCAAKAAVQNLTMSLSKALAGTGVTANCISPGTIRTERFESWVMGVGKQMGWDGDLDAIERRFIREIYPNTVGHAGQVDDIANAVAFLVSPLANFINGANLRVDGGQQHSMN